MQYEDLKRSPTFGELLDGVESSVGSAIHPYYCEGRKAMYTKETIIYCPRCGQNAVLYTRQVSPKGEAPAEYENCCSRCGLSEEYLEESRPDADTWYPVTGESKWEVWG